jgi:hypothetical protein
VLSALLSTRVVDVVDRVSKDTVAAKDESVWVGRNLLNGYMSGATGIRRRDVWWRNSLPVS